MTDVKKKVNALFDALEDVDELPAPVEAAINDLAEAAEAKTKIPAWKRPFFKDDKFSKTATFTTVAYVITLGWYAASAFSGQELDLGFMKLTLRSLDPTLATAVLGITSGTYVGNNVVKARAGNEGG